MYAPIRVSILISVLLALPLSAQSASLTKLSEVKRGAVSKLSVAGLNFGNSGLFVTAVRDSERKLRLLLWAADAAGRAEVRAVHTTEGTIKEVSASVLTGKRFATALRDSQDRLRVIAWQSSEDGRSITRLGTATGPKVRRVAAATGPDGLVFVAARDFGGKLMVSAFQVAGDSVVPAGRETYGGVSVVSAVTGTTQGTAMRDSAGRLRLIHFWSPLFRGGLGTGGAISDVRIGADGSGFSGEWFTFSIDNGPSAVRTGAGCTGRRMIGHGRGKLIGWKLKNTSIQADFDRTREKQLTGFGGIAKKADLVFLGRRGRLVTAHLGFDNFCRLLQRDQGKPRLQLTVWKTFARDDAFIKATDGHLGGDYTELGITEIKGSGNQDRFVVALRGTNGELKVTVWGVAD